MVIDLSLRLDIKVHVQVGKRADGRMWLREKMVSWWVKSSFKGKMVKTQGTPPEERQEIKTKMISYNEKKKAQRTVERASET